MIVSPPPLPPPRDLLIKKDKRLLYSGEPWQTPPNQVIKVNTGRNGMDGQDTPPIGHNEKNFTFVCSIPANNIQPESNHRKLSDKPKLRDMVQKN